MFKAMGSDTFKCNAIWNIVYGDDGISLEPLGDRDLGSSLGSGEFAVAVRLRQFVSTKMRNAKLPLYSWGSPGVMLPRA